MTFEQEPVEYTLDELRAQRRQRVDEMLRGRATSTNKLFRGIRSGNAINDTGLHDTELEIAFPSYASPRELAQGNFAILELDISASNDPLYPSERDREDPYTGTIQDL